MGEDELESRKTRKLVRYLGTLIATAASEVHGLDLCGIVVLPARAFARRMKHHPSAARSLVRSVQQKLHGCWCSRTCHANHLPFTATSAPTETFGRCREVTDGSGERWHEARKIHGTLGRYGYR
jgi:hypothetical protein